MNIQDFYTQDVSPFYTQEEAIKILQRGVEIAQFHAKYIQPHIKKSRKRKFKDHYQALERVIDYLQGPGWFKRANFGKEHDALESLLQIVLNVPHSPYSEDDLKSIVDHADGMFGFWSGITRDEIRERPYYHHLLLAAMMGMLLGLPADHVCALLRHDDLEDRSKFHNKRYGSLGVKYSRIDAEKRLGQVLNNIVFDIVKGLTNPEDFGGLPKQKWQRQHIQKLPILIAICKCLDRIANVADFGERKKANRDNVFEYLMNAAKLLEAGLDDSQESQLIWTFFAQASDFLYIKYLKPML